MTDRVVKTGLDYAILGLDFDFCFAAFRVLERNGFNGFNITRLNGYYDGRSGPEK